MNVIKLQWSDPQPPNESVPYNHVTAPSPFGDFLITWKGWKKYDSPTIDESPWGYGGSGGDVDDAKRIAQAEFERRVFACIAS
jgi:hypothetical protein